MFYGHFINILKVLFLLITEKIALIFTSKSNKFAWVDQQMSGTEGSV